MFSFNLLTIISTIVNLLALAWLIKRYLLGSIIRIMNERKQKIENAILEAENKLKEAEELKKQREEQLSRAREEASKIIQEAVDTAEKMKRDILQKAEDEAERIIIRAHEISMAERKRALEMAKKEILDLSKIIIKEFFRRFLPEGTEELIIIKFVNDMSSVISQVKPNDLEEVKFISSDNVKPSVKAQIEEKLRSIIPGNYKLSFEVDPNIGLGFKLLIGEFLIDNSIEYHLSQIYESLRGVENI
jgi:F-type H+-transporting ATPase subunit b